MITIKIDNSKKEKDKGFINIILDGSGNVVLSEYFALIQNKQTIINNIGNDILNKLVFKNKEKTKYEH